MLLRQRISMHIKEEMDGWINIRCDLGGWPPFACIFNYQLVGILIY